MKLLFRLQSKEGGGGFSHTHCQSAMESNLRLQVCKSRPFFNGLDLVGSSKKEVKPFPTRKLESSKICLPFIITIKGTEEKKKTRVVAMIIMTI